MALKHPPHLLLIDSLDEAAFPAQLRKNLDSLGYQQFTPIQKWALQVVNMGRDLMACAETGSGKTVSGLMLAMLLCRVLYDCFTYSMVVFHISLLHCLALPHIVL